MLRHAITDRQWEVVAPLLSGKATDCGVTAKDNRLFCNAVVWLMRTGVPWADLNASASPLPSAGASADWPKKASGRTCSRP